ncbi:MAG: biotin transporter BioY [Clostridia bacterium]|nr:biotin transporter BioY [Clostridia bacterium]
MSKSKSYGVKDLVLIALFAAICCVCGMITVPIGAVPITLATLGVMVSTMILGEKRAIISVILYIAIGLVGVPVFSSFQGGFGVIAGPTGGFIYSYIVMVPLVGIASKCLNKTLSSGMFTMIGCLAALFVCYFLGLVHFMIVMSVKGESVGLFEALCVCVFPFIPFDIVKSIIAIVIAPRIKPLCK